MSRIFLAPMEGLADCVLREVLTQISGYDGAVTEFIRVSQSLLPLRSFLRISPELAHGSRTASGVPVAVQLLGSDPPCMAENAAQLATLKPFAIDLNFGCPAPTVGRHGGGAVLLDDPQRIGQITLAVRQAVPTPIPVSAKMRLGVRDTGKAIACAQALEDAGASSLVVHARTRDEGYTPPARWEWVARIREAVKIPVIANGEIWTPADYARCREISGCADVMIGRGAIANPLLVRQIKTATSVNDTDWQEIQGLLAAFWQRLPQRMAACHQPGRIKLWLRALRQHFPEAATLYQAIRTLQTPEETGIVLEQHGIRHAPPEKAQGIRGTACPRDPHVSCPSFA